MSERCCKCSGISAVGVHRGHEVNPDDGGLKIAVQTLAS